MKNGLAQTRRAIGQHKYSGVTALEAVVPSRGIAWAPLAVPGRSSKAQHACRHPRRYVLDWLWLVL
jgi:hypothetical protein